MAIGHLPLHASLPRIAGGLRSDRNPSPQFGLSPKMRYETRR
jgi:hypothetical protein